MRVRDEFVLDPGVVFLNHGSFGACPVEVLAAQQAWQREMERNPVELLARRSAALLREAREKLAGFLGARADDLVFVSNATTGVNTVARSLDLGPGDEVLTTDHEYGACDAAWEWVCRREGARVVRVPIPLPFEPAELPDRLLSAVTAHTRVVYLSHITSTTALVFPVAEVCRRAGELGILSLVDGAHAPGHVPLDLEAVGADFYTGNCHKWMCAPKGAGFLHARAEHHARLDALVVSWGYCADADGHAGFAAFTGSTPLERRLQWQGTRDISAFLAVPAAIDFLERHDWIAAAARGHALAVATRDRVVRLTGLPAICRDADCGQMVAAELPWRDPEALRRELFERFRIEVPLTVHAGRLLVRPSFAMYSTSSDGDALLAALETVL
ncbi:MAG TPA: aminotransferase class V-fold PLP-dependent enzyme [Thermoanaerobaculaceae bacterium]|nr:aminotransferase class V-fold PLP-dependent enzyme [Thermoanaerobaculaceae bacterium]HRS15295.1 aminotransferase class V-fold PLP-dependent enzyme [Thermoanaerobaculaceae bacterium]